MLLSGMQDAPLICGVVSEAVEKVGPDNVVQVCMDGAAVCIAASALLEAKYVL